MRFGNEDGLMVELDWEADAPDPAASAADATRGALRLLLRGQPIWCGPDPHAGFSWTYIELLEFLTTSWPHICWEDGAPWGLRLSSPALLRARAEDRWDQLPSERREEEEQEFEAFEGTHDLARAFQGAILPSVLVVRQGEICYLLGDLDRVVARPLTEVLGILEDVMSAIDCRVSQVQDERARQAHKEWLGRLDVPRPVAVLIASGLTPQAVDLIEGGRPSDQVWELDEEHFDINELLAAARLSSGISVTEIRRLLDAVRQVPSCPNPALEKLGRQASEAISIAASRPAWAQGYELARWLRTNLGLDARQRVEPDQVLAKWGVAILQMSIEAPGVDAVACWGRNHGPAVLINKRGLHNGSQGGRRATYAHEVCHILADRSGALPLAEVLGGRTSPFVEVRARAFAAELLLPAEIAGDSMAGGPDPSRSARALQRRYGVSLELLAWQARNSEITLPNEVEGYLQARVSQPSQF